MAIASEKAHSTDEEPIQKKKKRVTEMKEDLHNAASHQFKHKSKKKKEKPECDEVQAGGLQMKEKDFSGNSVVLEYYDLQSTKKKDKSKHFKKKKQKNISSELVTEDHEEDQGISTNMITIISERVPHQFKHKSKKKDSADKKMKAECDEVQAGGLPLKNNVKVEDFSGKSVVAEYYALKSLRKKDKPNRLKKKKQKKISSKLATKDHEDDEGIFTNKMSKVISEREGARSVANGHGPVQKKKSKKDKETKKKKKKKKKLCREKEGKRTSLKEISERMTVDEAQDSEIMWHKKKSKKAARSGDGMATNDSVLGTNNQMDDGKERRHMKRKRNVTDVMDETNSLKTKKKRKEVVEEEAETEGLLENIKKTGRKIHRKKPHLLQEAWQELQALEGRVAQEGEEEAEMVAKEGEQEQEEQASETPTSTTTSSTSMEAAKTHFSTPIVNDLHTPTSPALLSPLSPAHIFPLRYSPDYSLPASPVHPTQPPSEKQHHPARERSLHLWLQQQQSHPHRHDHQASSGSRRRAVPPPHGPEQVTLDDLWKEMQLMWQEMLLLRQGVLEVRHHLLDPDGRLATVQGSLSNLALTVTNLTTGQVRAGIIRPEDV